ncbi:threonine ammonia-lyase [Sulfoacidibacillus thermotolerans]|uniref:threonine ammonia-lyase n=1 Tax=Sulfoacidibacillus thermotolerans TaxID=1765684 RepID=UPI001FE94EBD|nr:threonine ammonia-lyase [Sulfoacidibacillus thermotolerans]
MVHETPLTHSRTFSEMIGSSVFLKLENLQRTGAFKIRGAFNKVAQMAKHGDVGEVVTASAGNHAQGVAQAARMFGAACTVFMPEGAPDAKVQATTGYGATVVKTGRNYDEAFAAAITYANQRKAPFLHAFDDPYVIAGQGTIALEMLEQNPDLDTLVVPVGGGGLISGIAVAAKHKNPKIRIIGVQPERSNSGFLSWASGYKQVIANPSSRADGLNVKMMGQLPFEIIRKAVDTFVTVSEEEIERTMCLLLERSKMLVEGAGATALAALLAERVPRIGKNIGVIVSGGNVDLTVMSEVTHGFVPQALVNP